MPLLDIRTSGWREFARLPESISWWRLRKHLTTLPGVDFSDVACDRMHEAALSFTFKSHRFAIDLHDDAFRFRVENPDCPDGVMIEVVKYAGSVMRTEHDQ